MRRSMDGRAVQLEVAGQRYKVVSSASEEELQRLADAVSTKVAEVTPAGKAAPQAVLLAAMALAHELEEERTRRAEVEQRVRDMLRRVLVGIDDALAATADP